jgi:staphylococcal nuclease domain-containing protein 1
MKSEYLDVIVSDVRTHNGFGFSVQILNTEGKFPLGVDLQGP